jgi:hypothetical protein
VCLRAGPTAKPQRMSSTKKKGRPSSASAASAASEAKDGQDYWAPDLTNMTATILGDRSILEGDTTPDGKAKEFVFYSQGIDVFNEKDKSFPFVHTKNGAIQIWDVNGVEFLGKRVNITGKTARLELKDGQVLHLTDFQKAMTAPFATHQFLLQSGQQARVKLTFEQRLELNVKSRVIARTNEGYTVAQSFTVMNHFPFGLRKLKDLKVSFQENQCTRRPRNVHAAAAENFGMAAAACAMPTRMEIDQSVTDAASPVSVGPVENLPAGESLTFPLSAPVDIKVTEIYEKLHLDWNNKARDSEIMWEMTRIGKETLYPSFVDLPDEKGAITCTVPVPLRDNANNTPFEVSLGRRSIITVKGVTIEKPPQTVIVANAEEKAKGEKVVQIPPQKGTWSVTLKSHSDKKLRLRISGSNVGSKID